LKVLFIKRLPIASVKRVRLVFESDGSNIKDLSPLLNLKQLTHIDADNCQIVNLPRQITKLRQP
jgi:hypothetical protein